MPSTAMVHDYADGAGYTRWKMLCVAGGNLKLESWAIYFRSELGKQGLESIS